jgi:Zn-dependent protease
MTMLFGNKFKICTLFGIPVYLDISTAVMLVFFIGMTGSVALDLAAMALLLASIVMHELGHSLTARAFGCRTRDITLMLIGGCASLERLPYKAWQELLTAAAGPAVSFTLGIACYVMANICPTEFAAAALMIAAIMNFSLGAFNLLPGFPMDGGRIFRSAARAFTSRAKATWLAMVVGRACAGLLLLGPAMGISHIWIIPIGGSIFMRLLIAWMIWKEGWREYQVALAEEQWGGRWDYSARVSPPPYGGDEDETEIRRGR